MKYSSVAKLSDLPDGGKIKVSVDGEDILLTRFGSSYYAVQNKCTHMGGSLFDGKLDGQYIACPRHGTVFDVKSGEVHQNGKILMMKINPRALKTFPVSTDGESLLVGTE